MKVEALLHAKGRSVHVIAPEASVRAAVRRLTGPPVIGALAVCRPGERRLIGMISERDIVRGLGCHGGELLQLKVADVMSRPVPVCSRDDAISFVMKEMTRTRSRHLPVVEDGELVGLVSIGDVVKLRVEELELERGVLRDLYIASR